MNILRLFSIGTLIVLLTGCGLVRGGLAYFQSLDGFKELEDSGIYYEAGTKDIAVMVKQDIPGAISKVERKQFRPFKERVTVYICASKESFSKYSGASKMARGATFNKKIFVAPRASQTGTLKSILVHEMSHLQFNQYLGTRRYASNIPSWFQEGLAVNVSDSGGAEKVSYDVAKESILSGHSYAPNDSGSLFFPRTAYSFGLKPHMFYRQSSIFVRYLSDSYPSEFKNFLTILFAGNEFKTAFKKAFGKSINSAWEDFLGKIKA